MGLPYFEVTIQSIDDAGTDPPVISIGLAAEFADQVSARPGASIWSLGYHGNDGQVYEKGISLKSVFEGRIYGVGNTVGCGIDYAKSSYFFTLDGEIVCML